MGPQTVSCLGSLVNLQFSAQSAAEFGGTLSGFALYDRISLSGDDAKSARFVGDSISVTLTGGQTLSFNTTSALSGSLSVNDYKGLAVIDYVSDQQQHSDWGSLHGAKPRE